jgi:hypothetical protein
VQQSDQLKRKHSDKSTIQRAAIHKGNILDEGSCEHLACNSKYACDDDSGVLCPEDTRNAGKTKKPLLYCDIKCDKAGSCSDSDNWMALPKSRIKKGDYKKCGMNLVICANGNFTHAKVVDRSHIEAWEVSHGVQDDLGVNPYSTFKGSVYGDESDKDFKNDKNCS